MSGRDMHWYILGIVTMVVGCCSDAGWGGIVGAVAGALATLVGIAMNYAFYGERS